MFTISTLCCIREKELGTHEVTFKMLQQQRGRIVLSFSPVQIIGSKI